MNSWRKRTADKFWALAQKYDKSAQSTPALPGHDPQPGSHIGVGFLTNLFTLLAKLVEPREVSTES